MIQAGCVYLGLITHCPESFHPLHLSRRLITPCPTTNAISTKEYPKHPAWLTFPLSLPQTSLQNMEPPRSLSALSLIVRLTVALPCLNKGNLLLLRSALHFCLGPNYTLQSFSESLWFRHVDNLQERWLDPAPWHLGPESSGTNVSKLLPLKCQIINIYSLVVHKQCLRHFVFSYLQFILK